MVAEKAAGLPWLTGRVERVSDAAENLRIIPARGRGFRGVWRRGGDSNPRCRFQHNCLAGSPVQPLQHLSVTGALANPCIVRNTSRVGQTRELYKGTGAPWTTHATGNKMLWLNGMSQEVWDSTQNEVCLGPDVQAPREIQRRERCPEPGTRPWEAVKAAVIHGWRPVQVHATSSHGTRLYIQMLDGAMKEGNFSVEYMRNLRTTSRKTLGTTENS